MRVFIDCSLQFVDSLHSALYTSLTVLKKRQKPNAKWKPSVNCMCMIVDCTNNEPLIWAHWAQPRPFMHYTIFPVHNSHCLTGVHWYLMVWGWALKRKTDQFHNEEKRKSKTVKTQLKLTWKNLNNDYYLSGANNCGK